MRRVRSAWNLIGLAAATAAGAPIPIANSGFEADFAADGTFPVGTLTDWAVFDPMFLLPAGGNSVGVINPTGGDCFNMMDAPEGRNAALIFLSNDSTRGMGPVGLSQQLGATLEAETTYTLIVEVGNIASCAGLPPFDQFGFFELGGFPGYAVQLVAGGAVVAEDFNTLAGVIPEGEFRTSTIELVVGASHPQLGGALEIRLLNLNMEDTPEDPGIEVDFDDVRLDASANPPSGCSPADLADPFGVISQADSAEFVARFFAGDAGVAALSEPFDVVSQADVSAFVQLFFEGCQQ